MVDTTTPLVEDLQINLEDNTQAEKIAAERDKELNFNLDLNLSDAPKDDDRLKIEDKKNEEIATMPSEEITESEQSEIQQIFKPADEIPTQIISEPVNAPTESQQIFKPVDDIEVQAVSEPTNEQQQISKTIEEVPTEPQQIFKPTDDVPTQIINEPVSETVEPQQIFKPVDDIEVQAVSEPTNEQQQISKTIEEVDITSPKIIGEDISKNASLENDMKIINELEGQASIGGLAKEANLIPQEIKIEAPKTFDLDAMLGNPQAVTIPTPTIEIPKISVPVATPIPVVIPTPEFTIPTTTTQVPVQAISQTTIPHKKKAGMKTFLFIIMFIGLGFTTFFILKTMYPLEFDSILGGETPIHASAIDTGTEIIEPDSTEQDEVITGTTNSETTGTEVVAIEETPIVEVTNDNIDTTTGDNVFGELADLGHTAAETPTETNISKLTEYVNQGNDFLAQGRAMNNNTVIKYSLYITKKATTFLEDIANGKEINNLSGYFAQFDQYLVELKNLVGKSDTTNTVPTFGDATASTTQQTNDSQGMTPGGFGNAQ